MIKKLNASALVGVAILAVGSWGASRPARAQEVLKVGVFDSKEVFEGSSEGRRLQRMLEARRTELKQSVDDKEAEGRLLQQKLREGEFTLSDDKKGELQKSLQRKLVELDSLRQEASNNLRIEVEDVQSQLNRKLLAVVAEVGRENGYSLILEKKTQAVFASPSIDITDLVIERFNSKYPATDAAAGE